LGVTLYLALSGQPSAAGIQLAALRTRRPEITAELAAIIERATAPRADDRFATAGELEHALAVHLARRFPSVTRASLVDVVRAHMSQRGDSSAQPLASAELASLTRVDTRFYSASTPSGERSEVAAVAASPRRTQPFRGRRSRQRIAALALLGVAASLGGYLWWSASQRKTSQVIATPQPAPPTPAALPTAPTPPRSRSVKKPQPVRAAAAATKSTAMEMGWLSINSDPWGAVYLDGHKVADDVPVYRLPVLAGHHRVTIVNPQHKNTSPAREVMVEAGQTRTLSIRW
jgi:hypothetical protein